MIRVIIAVLMFWGLLASYAVKSQTFPGLMPPNTVYGNPGSAANTPQSVPFAFNNIATQCNIEAFGAATTNTAAANTTAINAGLTSATCGGLLSVPIGTYQVNSTLNITQNGGGLIGAGSNKSIILDTNAASPVITIASNLIGCQVKGLEITRSSISSTSGAVGIFFSGDTELCDLYDLIASKHVTGFAMGPTNWGFMNQLNSRCNSSHGFTFILTSAVNPLQWQMFNLLSEFNGGSGQGSGSGFVISVSSGNLSVGEMRGMATFANSGWGIFIQATGGASLEGLRLYDSFFGADQLDEVFLDSHSLGSAHKIAGVYTELAGEVTTGAGSNALCGGGSSASPNNGAGGLGFTNLGYGFNITANNNEVVLENDFWSEHSLSGVLISATKWTVNGGNGASNGQCATLVSPVTGCGSTINRAGILSQGGKGAVTSTLLTSNGGAVCAGTTPCQITGVYNNGASVLNICQVVVSGLTNATQGTVGGCTSSF